MSIPNPTNNFERLLYRLATGMGIIPKKPSSRAEAYLMEIAQNGGFGSLKPTKVNTTTYPTLESFLASTGEDKRLYLYPNAEEGYSEWIWLSEDSAYEKVGDTDVKLTWGSIDGDISDQTDLKTALDGKIADAPSDGKLYVRKNRAWSEISIGKPKYLHNISVRKSGTYAVYCNIENDTATKFTIYTLGKWFEDNGYSTKNSRQPLYPCVGKDWASNYDAYWIGGFTSGSMGLLTISGYRSATHDLGYFSTQGYDVFDDVFEL